MSKSDISKIKALWNEISADTDTFTITAFSSKVSQLIQEYRGKDKLIISLKEDNEYFQKELQSFETKNRQLRADNRDLEKKIKEKDANTLGNISKQSSDLKEALSEREYLEKELSKLKKSHSEDIMKAEKYNKNLEGELGIIRAKLSSYESEMVERENELNFKLKETQDIYESRERSLKNEIQQIQKEFDSDLQAELESVREEFERREKNAILSLKDQHASEMDEISFKHKEELEKLILKLSNDTQRLTKDFELRIEELKMKLERSEDALVNSKSQYFSQREELQEQADQLQEQLDALKKENLKLSSELVLQKEEAESSKTFADKFQTDFQRIVQEMSDGLYCLFIFIA
jgi:DNA repair exonuclease SbcCD ATPase subunit